MNTPLRRVGLAMLAMVVLLLANATYIQIVKADEYRDDPRNRRVLLEEYSRQRGKILTSDEVIIANVKSTNDRLQYQRTYANGPMYAPITGFYSVRYGSTGLESAENDILNGSDDRLFVRRLSDLITGRDPRGGNIVTTINSKVQQAAYDSMMSNGFTGAVVAIKPDDGQILAMVSTPSYDPSGLASPDGDVQQQTYDQYKDDNNPAKPMLNRAISENYQPGSTFKLVTASAALADGKDKNSQVTQSPGINVINGDTNCDVDDNTCLANYSRSTCGDGTMQSALQHSCNTAFAQLADQLGKDKLLDQASKFGIGETGQRIPLRTVASCVGAASTGQCMDIPTRPALFQSGIGQKDVRLTAQENCSIAATIANDGARMRPQLVQKILAPDLDEISGYDADQADQAMSGSDANELRDMMVKSEENTSGPGKRDDLTIASKTGTAETGVDPKNSPPFAWYVAFAPADNPQIAVAVVVDSKDVAATGGKLAAGVGRAAINAMLGGS
jgi:peptidoglycan glycosyltransferase